MPSTFNAVCSALVALAYWTALGFAIARRLLHPTLALPLAPIAGWAVHGVVAVPLFFVVPFTAPTIVGIAALMLAAAWWPARRPVDPTVGDRTVRVAPWAWAAAALLALGCAAAIVPKQVGDVVLLSDPIFDHAKVAIVDDIARLGMPPGNPFIARDGGSGRLSYYYLWHFSAAELTRALGVRGWEAEIAMTFFSAFTSLAAMMAIAVRFAGRSSASSWVVLLAATSSARVVLIALLGATTVDAWLRPPGGFGGWLFQSSWVPQHLASTSCVLLALLTMNRLSARPGALPALVVAAAVAAAFESSTWIGGVVLALVAAVVVPLLIVRADRARRPGLVGWFAVVGAVALILVSPLLVDQLAAAALRQTGAPVAVRLFRVLGPAVPAGIRALADGPAFWLALLPVELTAVFVVGVVVAMRSLSRGRPAEVATFAAAAIVALLASWTLASTLADNNDLAWRAALLASTLLIVLAAVGLASWVARRRVAAGLAIAAIAIGLPEAALQIHRNLVGHARPEGRLYATVPRLWTAVRAVAAADERVANNPESLAAMTPWAVNIGWALLADRRSCYATWELTQVYSSVPHDRLRAIDAEFVRVFAGKALPGDVERLATTYDCAVAVVTPEDGAWTDDPFRASAAWRLVDDAADRWRIYRRR